MTESTLRRRGLFCGATLALTGGLLLGLPERAAAQGRADLGAVLSAVALQQALGVAYADMSRRAALGRDLRDLLAHLADHERQHAASLLALAEYLGGPPPPIPTLAQVEAALPSVRAATDRTRALATLDELERAEILGFYSDQQILTDIKLIEHVAAVMCSDAQHLALARELAGRDPIPSAFETGQAR